MCMWVRAMDLYSKVFRTVEPKRERYVKHIHTTDPLIHHILCYCRLKTARAELDKMMAELKEKEEALEVVETKVRRYQNRRIRCNFLGCFTTVWLSNVAVKIIILSSKAFMYIVVT